MTFSGAIATSGSQPARTESGRNLPSPAAVGCAQPPPDRGVAGPMLCLLTMLCLLCGPTSPALAAGATFELAQVLGVLKAEITAADAPGGDGGPSVRIEEAQVDLALVEVSDKTGTRLAVPGNDFATGKEDALKVVLKRRVVVELTSARDAKMAGPEEPAVRPPDALGNLARTITGLRTALRTAVASPPTYELKRVGIDLEFALERNAKGVASIIVFGGVT